MWIWHNFRYRYECGQSFSLIANTDLNDYEGFVAYISFLSPQGRVYCNKVCTCSYTSFQTQSYGVLQIWGQSILILSYYLDWIEETKPKFYKNLAMHANIGLQMNVGLRKVIIWGIVMFDAKSTNIFKKNVAKNVILIEWQRRPNMWSQQNIINGVLRFSRRLIINTGTRFFKVYSTKSENVVLPCT